jgi:small GTP-binding protein
MHGDLTDGNQVIDDAVVVLVDENTADLNLHGGTWVVQRVLELARREGFEAADCNAMPLPLAATDAAAILEGEILSHLPMAQTELGVRMLLAQRRPWETLDSIPPDETELRRILEDATLDCLIRPRRLAIIGAANVGKSTLANQLFARERSITADVPGTTRDWVGEIANIDGLPVMLLDTPGMRQTHDPIEAAAIRSSAEEVGRADAILLVIDASRALDAEQSGLLQQFPSALRVVNKADQPCGWAIDQLGGITTVATRGIGIDRLRRQIIRHLCGEEPIEIDRPRCWTDRQRELLQAAISKSRMRSSL